MEEKVRDFREGKLPLPVGKSDWEEVAGHCYCVESGENPVVPMASELGPYQYIRDTPPNRREVLRRALEAEGITDIMKFGYAFYAKKSAIQR